MTRAEIEHLDELLRIFMSRRGWEPGQRTGHRRRSSMRTPQLGVTGLVSKCCRSYTRWSRKGVVLCEQCGNACKTRTYRVAKREGTNGGWQPASHRRARGHTHEPNREWNVMKLRETHSSRPDVEDESAAREVDSDDSMRRLFARPRKYAERDWVRDLTLWSVRAKARSFEESVDLAKVVLGETWEPEQIRYRVNMAREIVWKRLDRPRNYPSLPRTSAA